MPLLQNEVPSVEPIPGEPITAQKETSFVSSHEPSGAALTSLQVPSAQDTEPCMPLQNEVQ